MFQREQAPLGRELLEQLALVQYMRAGDQYSIEGAQVLCSTTAVFLAQDQIGQPQCVEAALGGADHGRVDLHRDHARRQLAQQGGQVASASTYMEYIVLCFHLRMVENFRYGTG